MDGKTIYGESDLNRHTEKITIAIIGAGTAGLFAAIALLKKFGDKVSVSVFDKQPYFDFEKGVEISVNPAFQLAMREIDLDFKKLRALGYPLCKDERVLDTNLATIDVLEKNLVGRYTGFVTPAAPEDKPLNQLQLFEYSTKRGILMDFLHQELLKANHYKENVHWDFKLTDIVTCSTGQLRLIFSNQAVSTDFDLVIGADGVHSQVRNLYIDRQPPRHIGANILYGVIPRELKQYEPNRFHIIVGDLTIVLSRYLELNGHISTWWGLIYPDREMQMGSDVAFWEKQNSSTEIKAFAAELSVKTNNAVLADLINQTPAKNFKYAGKFLERNPADLENWGRNNVVLVGDAIHAMMPWAGNGAGMAAEDGLTLMFLFKKYNVFENRARFKELLHTHVFAKIYKEYKEQRINRLSYFYIKTHQMAPHGLLSLNDINFSTDIKEKYGDQYDLSHSPHFTNLMRGKLSSVHARHEFFETNTTYECS